MAKAPDSSKSESWTARIPNDLADLARNKAISLGMLKLGGKPNTTLIIHAALKTWLELPNDISNAVSDDTSNELSNGVMQILESRLDELTNVISNTVKRNELVRIEKRLKELETLIADLVSSQVVANLKNETNLVSSEVVTNLSTIGGHLEVLSTIGTHFDILPNTETQCRPLAPLPPEEQVEVWEKAVEIAIANPENLSTITNQAIADSPEIESENRYPMGTKLDFKELGQHLGFHPTNYSTDAKKLGQSPDEFIDSRAIAKGEFWERGKEGKRAVFTRVK